MNEYATFFARKFSNLFLPNPIVGDVVVVTLQEIGEDAESKARELREEVAAMSAAETIEYVRFHLEVFEKVMTELDPVEKAQSPDEITWIAMRLACTQSEAARWIAKARESRPS